MVGGLGTCQAAGSSPECTLSRFYSAKFLVRKSCSAKSKDLQKSIISLQLPLSAKIVISSKNKIRFV